MFAIDVLPATPLDALTNAALLVALLDLADTPDRALVQATDLLTIFGGLLGLERATPADLEVLGGLTGRQATRLQAALALARRLVRAERPDPQYVRGPGDIGPLLVAEMRPLEQEVFRVILLKTDGALLKMIDLYAGTHSATSLEIAEVFREPIRRGADKILLAHNHPSHSLTISAGDIATTQQLIAAGKLLDIPVEDHIVVGYTWVSMRQLGLFDWS